MNANSPVLWIAGKGRIGAELFRQLSTKGYHPETVYIDPVVGIKSPSSRCDVLIICIASTGKSWSWDSILNGLAQQIENKQIEIQQILLVSSTRVYDGLEQGLVTAKSAVSPLSDKAKQIVAGEQIATQCARFCWVLRCSGLYGKAYPVYDAILKQGDDKVRFGIDSQTVVCRLEQLVEHCLVVGRITGVEILTDGFVYFQGKRYQSNDPFVLILAEQHRVLLASQTAQP